LGSATELDSATTGGSSGSEYFYTSQFGDSEPDSRLLSIPITGPILTDGSLGGEGFSLFSTPIAAYGYQIKEQLYRAAEDEDIKGVVLEIDSPGGTIAGSKAVSDGVAYYKEQTGNPVVAYISGAGVSGSYWAAISADEVYADYGTIVGSIGVIFGPFKYYDKVLEEGSILGSVLTQNGIETRYFTGGQFKDAGNPYRQLSEAEAEVFQENVSNEYDQFVAYVVEQRELSEQYVREDVRALLYGTAQAIELGLIDEVATREQSYAKLAEAAGLGEDYEIVREDSMLGFWETLFGVFSPSKESTAAELSEQIELLQNSCALCDQPLYFHGNPQFAFSGE
ncbi:MAG: S49 family peptidase, partial [Candidatus Dojkabacteria bacterium]